MQSIEPEEVGLSTSRLHRIGAVLQGYVDRNELPGAIAVVLRWGQVAYLKPFGMMDVEACKPMQLDTIFRIYSMTKPVASVAFMMLYEEGRCQLSDPISRFFPGFADTKVFAGVGQGNSDSDEDRDPLPRFAVAEPEEEITIKHLLTHTAGLSYDFWDDSPVDEMYRQAELVDDLGVFRPRQQDFIQKLARLPLVFRPGRAWRYSMATDVIGCLVEVISGMPLDAFLQERILGPLEMVDTAFYVPDTKLERLAALYGPGESGGLELLDAPATSPFSEPPRFLSAGNGLVSTAADFLRFAAMLLNGGELEGTRLLSRKTVELMTMNHLPAELIPIEVQPHTLHGCGFGLGFRVVVDAVQAGMLASVGEYGWGGAASTSFFVDPKEGLVGLLLTQFMPSRYYPIRNQFKGLVYQALVD